MPGLFPYKQEVRDASACSLSLRVPSDRGNPLRPGLGCCCLPSILLEQRILLSSDCPGAGQDAPQRILSRLTQLLYNLSATVLQGVPFSPFTTFSRKSSWRDWNGERPQYQCVCVV
ncbi:hypothetical protein QQF64_000736 [Cirrhinus molitorella]|uniref:Uncharacterized protein n=1 Tax=Cirrhinus molitorella TaxID=172907 RepID=A0ABR3NZ09_9TELE